MKQKNPKLMLALAGLGVGAFIVCLIAFTHGGNVQATAKNTNSSSVTSYDLESGDTNTEVLNTVVANQKKLEQRNDVLAAKNEQLEAANQQQATQQISQVKGTLTDQLDQLRDELQSQLSNQKSALSNSPAPSANSAWPLRVIAKASSV